MIAGWKKLLQQSGAIFAANLDPALTCFGADAVVNFGNFASKEAEYYQVSSIVAPLAYTLITVTGANAKKFLQGQLTCDVAQVNSTNSCLGAYCNLKGRIICMLRLSEYADGYALRVPTNLTAQICAELKKYGAFSKINIQELTASHVVLGIAGKNSAAILAQITTKLPEPAKIHSVKINSPNRKTNNTSQVRYEIYLPIALAIELWPLLTTMAKPVGVNAWELLEILDEIPEIYPATSAEFLPHYLNLPELSAVSFTKGCYRGQEIVARMQYRGSIKRHLYRLSAPIDNADDLHLPPGIGMFQEQRHELKKVGSIVRTAVMPHYVLALVELADEAASTSNLYSTQPVMLHWQL